MSGTGGNEKFPHIVAVPAPTQGHVSPFLHLCTALASRGIVITFVNTEGNQRSMKNTLPGVQGLDIRFETVPGLHAAEVDLAVPESRRKLAQGLVDMGEAVEKLLTEKIVGKGPPISCLLCDLILSYWPQDIASKIGVPCITFWSSNASSILLESASPLMLENGDIPVNVDAMEKRIDYIRGLSPLPLWALPAEFSHVDEDPGFAGRYRAINHFMRSPVFVTNTFEELEGGAFAALKEIKPNSLAVGPLFLATKTGNASLWKEDTECLAWLDKQKQQSVLFISFGSVVMLSLEQFEEISKALEELQKPFLWAIRPKCVTGMDPEVLDSFKKRVASFGMVINWAPQMEILKHPSTGGFVSHCGWNSILEAIVAGVPVICWPGIVEQHLNCKLIHEDWKIGIKVPSAVARKLVVKDEFVALVLELMDEERGAHIRCNMNKVAEKAHRTVSTGGSSHQNMEKLVKILKSPSNS